MKIICIGKNYLLHVKEFDGKTPQEPVFFLKPETALVKDNQPFYLPDFSSEIHHELEVVLKISKSGKNIEEKFANKYYQEISLGIDFTARDLQMQLKKEGLPWEKAKAFDGSAPIGIFVNKKEYDLHNINFELKINNQTVQKGNTSNMLFSFDKVVSFVSTFITIKTGDLIFTGTPEGVGKVSIGDKLEAFLEEKKLLEFQVK